jgi:hypothetical protein
LIAGGTTPDAVSAGAGVHRFGVAGCPADAALVTEAGTGNEFDAEAAIVVGGAVTARLAGPLGIVLPEGASLGLALAATLGLVPHFFSGTR